MNTLALLALLSTQTWAPSAAAPAPVGAQVQYRWDRHPSLKSDWVLWDGPRHVGSYNVDRGLYYAWDGRAFAAPSAPPVALPAGAEAVENYGNHWTPNGRDRWTAAGHEVTATVAARDLVDDSGKGFVVAVGDRADALARDWPSLPAEWRDAYHAQAYPEGHAVAAQRGYGPGLYVLGPAGKLLLGTPGYAGPGDLVERLRRLRDGKPLINPRVDFNFPGWAWAVVGFVLALLLSRRQTQ